MGIGTAIAVYFIFWWVTLFATLPFGLKTQGEARDVTLGTVESAPAGRHMPKVLLRNTIVATLLFGVFWYVTQVIGFGISDVPHIIPEY
ncbi:MAG: DUF1467 family protein [Brucellaceae bacterium]|nr:DUF1467 family protein [Brucellaceae bacterium]